MRAITIGTPMLLPPSTGSMGGGHAARLVRRGAITGAWAFLGGALLVYVSLRTIGGAAGLLARIEPIAAPTWGYAAMHASSAVWLGEPALLVLALVPAGILAWAGSAVARRTNDLPVSPPVRGAVVTVGYFCLTALSALFLVVRSGAGEVYEASFGGGGFDLLPVGLTLVLAGLIFPIVFGGVGGYVQALPEG